MKRDGFTIVEVMIFLAISGLMLVLAMIGSGNLARQTRYSDTINSFQSTMQRQYEGVANGVNPRLASEASCPGEPSSQPGSDRCVVLGKVLSFNHNGGQTVTARYVLDDPSPAYTATGTVQQQIAAAMPQVSLTGAETFDLSWGASFQTASRETTISVAGNPVKPGSNRAIINNVAYLRSPNGSQILPYFFYSAAQDATSVQTALRLATTTSNRTTGTKAYLCITNREEWVATSAPVAAILLGAGNGSVGIDTKFTPTRSNVVAAECGV